MPRYFFHLRSSDQRIDDPEGSELPDLLSARAEALEAARQILSETLRAGGILDGQAFEIADEAGHVLDVVPLKSAIRSS